MATVMFLVIKVYHILSKLKKEKNNGENFRLSKLSDAISLLNLIKYDRTRYLSIILLK